MLNWGMGGRKSFQTSGTPSLGRHTLFTNRELVRRSQMVPGPKPSAPPTPPQPKNYAKMGGPSAEGIGLVHGLAGIHRNGFL